MIRGDIYKHFKGGVYRFECIALPLLNKEGELDVEASEFRHFQQYDVALDAHTPDGEEISKIKLYMSTDACYIDSKYPHVLYQAEKDWDTAIVWARQLDDFFGAVNKPSFEGINRFTLIG